MQKTYGFWKKKWLKKKNWAAEWVRVLQTPLKTALFSFKYRKRPGLFFSRLPRASLKFCAVVSFFFSPPGFGVLFALSFFFLLGYAVLLCFTSFFRSGRFLCRFKVPPGVLNARIVAVCFMYYIKSSYCRKILLIRRSDTWRFDLGAQKIFNQTRNL